jgi:hypothetical protein
LAILVCVYPLVTLVSLLIGLIDPDLPLWARTALLCPVIVGAVVWVIIPFILNYLRAFVFVCAEPN